MGSKEIEWEVWCSEDEANQMDEGEIEDMDRSEIERDLEYNKQRLLMLCRLLRSKSQEYESRVEIEQNKYQSLTAQYNAKKEDNYKLRKQNNNLEKEYEKVENERIATLRNIK